jgi:hypothetical protein
MANTTQKPYPHWLPAAIKKFEKAILTALSGNRIIGQLEDGSFVASEKLKERQENSGFHVPASVKLTKFFKNTLPDWIYAPHGVFYIRPNKHGACLFAASPYEIAAYCAEHCLLLTDVLYLETHGVPSINTNQIIKTSSNEVITVSQISGAQTFQRVKIEQFHPLLGTWVINTNLYPMTYLKKSFSTPHVLALTKLTQFSFGDKILECFYKRTLKRYTFPERKKSAIGIDTNYTIEEYRFHLAELTKPLDSPEDQYIKTISSSVTPMKNLHINPIEAEHINNLSKNSPRSKKHYLRVYVIYGCGYVNEHPWEHIALAQTVSDAKHEVINHQNSRIK